MAKEKPIVVEGVVEETLPNVMFRVRLDCNDAVILCQSCGNMRRNYIKLLEGDRVRIEMSPYDMTRGRITHRL
jgi:translation initiation factor IF-1